MTVNFCMHGIRKAWFNSVARLRVDGREMIALDLDEALWHLSKYGCPDRDLDSDECPHYATCEAKAFCVRGKVAVQAKGVVLAT